MKMVQVSNEAKASPIITALTSTSADWNIDHGDISGTAAIGFSNLLSAGVAVASAAAGAAGTAAAGVGACAAGATCAGATGACGCTCEGAGGAEGAAFCCAKDNDGSDAIAKAKVTTHAVREGSIFIRRPSGE